MAILVNYVLVTGKVIKDSNTLRYSYIDVIRDFEIPAGQNSIVETFLVVGRLDNIPDGDANIEISIINADTNSIVSAQMLRGKGLVAGGINFNATFVSTFSAPGKYLIKIKYNDVVIVDGDRNYFFVLKK